MVVNNEVKRPLLQYFGGKWLLAPWILSHMPSHKFYVELFGGGGSVLLRKPRSYQEVYNDLDVEIVNVFRVLRDNPQELIRKLDLTPYAREEYELACEFSEDHLERARRTIVRSYFGYSGCGSMYDVETGKGRLSAFRGISAGGNRPPGFRTGEFSSRTPIPLVWDKYPDVLLAIVDRLKAVTIENKDAFDLIPVWDSPGTVFYADPPYLASVRKTKSVYKYELSDKQHVALAKVLNKVQGCVVVSGYDSPLYDKLYEGWDRYEKVAQAQGGGRMGTHQDTDRIEVLWVKPAGK
jgi:DNA adenine methylase